MRSWEPAADVAHCPGCGAASVEVNEGRNDYYLGDLYRCTACGIGFHFTPADPAPVRVRGGESSGFAELLRESGHKALAQGADIFLAELERGGPDSGAVRVPIIRGDG